MAHGPIRPADSSVYYDSELYWNAIPEVRAYQDRLAMGDAAPLGIWRFAAERYGVPRFERALVLNCGNGWVERALVAGGVLGSAVGVDIADDLLAGATAAAAADGLAISYVRLDINEDELPAGDFDLVINYAAAHHIAYLDRVFRRLAAQLPASAVFLHWDYCGPARNQYPLANWNALWELNQALPPEFRRKLDYPHLKTMLAGDPTEAIHSDLIVSHLERYFTIDHLRPTGGALAYETLRLNPPFYAPGPEQARWVRYVLDADEEYLGGEGGDLSRSHFFYGLSRPRPDPIDPATLAAWTAAEEEREMAAAADGGRYGPPTLLEDLYARVYDGLVEEQRLHARVDELAARIERLEQPKEGLRVFARSVPGVRPVARTARRLAGGLRPKPPSR
jgi:SAM-dependent methyltransferase